MTDKIHIMTMNLRFGLARDGDNAWENRKDLAGKILERYPADFCGFQEVNHFQADFLKERLKDHACIGQYNRGNPWWQSNMIFFHRSWACLGHRHHFLSPTPDIPSKLEGSKWPRQCVVGWFGKGGRQVIVANTHFDFDPLVQVRSAGLVKEFLDRFPRGLPRMVVGDFNSDPGSPAHRYFLSRGFDEVLPDRQVTTFHEFTGDETGRHIDWILYAGGLTLDSARVVTDDFSGRYPSDHYPVRAEFRLGPETGSRTEGAG